MPNDLTPTPPRTITIPLIVILLLFGHRLPGLARSLGAKLTALNVTSGYHPAFESEGFVMPEMKSLRERFEKEETAHSKKLLAEVQALAAQMGVNCEGVTVTGGSARSLAKRRRSRRNTTQRTRLWC